MVTQNLTHLQSIEGSYKALDISDVSDFDQHEVLVKGTFKVDSVEDVWMPVENGFKRHVRKIGLMAIGGAILPGRR